MAVVIEDVLNTARMFLNDASQQLWTDAVLMPMVQRAHRELQTTLKQRAAPIMKSSNSQTIQPNTQTITTISDMLAPIQIIESASGGVGTLMTEADPLPLVTPTTSLNWWNWNGTTVNFIGATTIRNVLIYYWRILPLPQSGTDPLNILEGELWLAPRTAAIAAASVGEENTSATAANNADMFLEKVILANRGRAPQDAGASTRP